MDQQLTSDGNSGRVLRFPGRVNGSQRSSEASLAPPSPVDDVGKYERAGPEPDNYRHRMLMNLAGLLVCGILVLFGVWIANKMAQVRHDQDCVLSGRRNCAEIPFAGPIR